MPFLLSLAPVALNPGSRGRSRACSSTALLVQYALPYCSMVSLCRDPESNPKPCFPPLSPTRHPGQQGPQEEDEPHQRQGAQHDEAAAQEAQHKRGVRRPGDQVQVGGCVGVGWVGGDWGCLVLCDRAQQEHSKRNGCRPALSALSVGSLFAGSVLATPQPQTSRSPGALMRWMTEGHSAH